MQGKKIPDEKGMHFSLLFFFFFPAFSLSLLFFKLIFGSNITPGILPFTALKISVGKRKGRREEGREGESKHKGEYESLTEWIVHNKHLFCKNNLQFIFMMRLFLCQVLWERERDSSVRNTGYLNVATGQLGRT